MAVTRRQLLVRALPGIAWPLAPPADALASALAVAPAPALAPRLASPSLYTDAIDPSGYLVSEKYDGVRGFWDGATLRHRSGRVVSAPAWFTERLPRGQALDGELWLARGRFDALSGIVRRAVPIDLEWRDVRFMVFELPQASGPFSERAARIEQLATTLAWPPLTAVLQTPVADRAELHRRLAATVAQGGEGLVLHRADADYRAGRSEVVFKLKPELDTEAIVVAHRPGQGKYAGQLGALEVSRPDGRRFLIGTGFSDAARRAPPPIGSSVTYRYRDLTSSGLPRFASFLRVHDGAL